MNKNFHLTIHFSWYFIRRLVNFLLLLHFPSTLFFDLNLLYTLFKLISFVLQFLQVHIYVKYVYLCTGE